MSVDVKPGMVKNTARVATKDEANIHTVSWSCNDKGRFKMECSCRLGDCRHQQAVVRGRFDRLEVAGDGVFRLSIPVVLPLRQTFYESVAIDWRQRFNIIGSADGIHEVEWIRHWSIGGSTRAGQHVPIGFIDNNACRDDILQLVRPYAVDEALGTPCSSCGWMPCAELDDTTRITERQENDAIRDWWFMLNNTLFGKGVTCCRECYMSKTRVSAYGDDLIPSV